VNAEKTVEITGLQLIDYLELAEQFPPGTVRRLPAPTQPAGAHGEPTLVTVLLTLTAASAQVLTAWLVSRQTVKTAAATPAATAGTEGITLTISPDRSIILHMGATPSQATETGKEALVSGIQAVTSAILKEAESG